MLPGVRFALLCRLWLRECAHSLPPAKRSVHFFHYDFLSMITFPVFPNINLFFIFLPFHFLFCWAEDSTQASDMLSQPLSLGHVSSPSDASFRLSPTNAGVHIVSFCFLQLMNEKTKPSNICHNISSAKPLPSCLN